MLVSHICGSDHSYMRLKAQVRRELHSRCSGIAVLDGKVTICECWCHVPGAAEYKLVFC